MLEVKRELSMDDLDNFFWSGAKDRWDDADEDQREEVWARLEDVFDHEIPTETEVNDYVWFECDDIFFRRDESLIRRNLRERREKNELFGLFGKKKKKEDTLLSNKEKCEIVKDCFNDYIKNSGMEGGWYTKKAKVDPEYGYVVIDTMYGASMQYLCDSELILVGSEDISDKRFECPIKNGKLSKANVGKAIDYLRKVNKDQGRINREK